MELFSLNRYDEDIITDDPVKEDELLQNLIKKAEKRRRELQSLNSEVKNTSAVINKQETDYHVEEIKKVKLNTENQYLDDNSKVVEEIQEKQIQKEQHSEDKNELKILGDDLFKKNLKVDMVLPSWLAYPTIITNKINENINSTTSKTINDLKLLPNIIEALKNMGIEKLFPVQNEVIPWILNAYSKPPPFRPQDICVSAPTGSGKTLAFAIPIVQLLSKRIERKIRALIVLPVNELALQVYYIFKNLTSKTNLSVCLLSKSCSLLIEQQKLIEYLNNKYYSKVDIIITTPGRLVEHIHSTKGFLLDNLKFLVIDEADKILDQIHHNWLYHLDNHVKNISDNLLSKITIPLSLNNLKDYNYQKPHKMLFSATLSQDPEKLQNLQLFKPKLFTSVIKTKEELIKSLKIDNNKNEKLNEIRGEFIGKYTTPAALIEKFCITENQLKPLTLYTLIKENSWNKFLCFTNSTGNAHRLSFVLSRLFKDKSIADLSANLKPSERTKILNSFAIGKIKGLVCSDALARGIDIPDIDIVISYEMPRHIKTYIHRIGRTARAGRSGTAVTLLTQDEFEPFNKILAEVGKESLSEIKVESNIELENAKMYSDILKQLKRELERERKIRNIQKNLISRNVIPSNENQSTSGMSLMERLQIQASEIVTNQLKKKVEEHDKKISLIKRKRKIKNTINLKNESS